MNLNDSGNIIRNQRKALGLTQKELAEKLGVLPKTISKWETAHGFPDVSIVSELSKILGISTDSIISGSLNKNKEETGNMKKTKFFVCPDCGSIHQAVGNGTVICCGKELSALEAKEPNEKHQISIEQIENDYFITSEHPMTKEHYIEFIAYVTFDRAIIVRLYPEQNAEIRMPRMFGGKFYYYCNQHGLFAYDMRKA